MNALGTDKIIHIYGDTTLEYPETGTYLEEFKKIHPTTPLLVAKNKEQNFNELCKVIGPPSRMMRWCCTKIYLKAMLFHHLSFLRLCVIG